MRSSRISKESLLDRIEYVVNKHESAKAKTREQDIILMSHHSHVPIIPKAMLEYLGNGKSSPASSNAYNG